MGGPHLVQAFVAGSRVWDWEADRSSVVEILPAGELDATAGVIVLADPTAGADDLQASRTVVHGVPRGRWPVELRALRPLAGEQGSQIVGARVRFDRNRTAVRWDGALVDEDGVPFAPYPQYSGVSPGSFDVKGPFLLVADSLRLPTNGEDLVQAWWGRDGAAHTVELVVSVDRLMLAWIEVFVPARLLLERGRVSHPELDAAGVVLDVLGPQDLPGHDCAVVFRTLPPVERTGVQIDRLDKAGAPVWVDGVGTSRDGWSLTGWKDPDFSRIDTLRLRVPLQR